MKVEGVSTQAKLNMVWTLFAALPQAARLQLAGIAIPEIARVPGIDMLFLGPLDLSASIDRLARYDDPAMCELVDEAERRTIEAGLVLGGPTYPGASTAALFERGYRFVTIASDVALLRDGALTAAQAGSNFLNLGEQA